MATYALSSYTVRIKRLGTGEYEQLGSFGANYSDFLAVLDDFLQERRQELSHDTEQKKLLRVETSQQQDRIEFGIIETGEYGIESELLNVDTQEASYIRQISDAEMLPFYFEFKIPPDKDEGIAILQRYKQFGIRGYLGFDLNGYFRDRFPAFRLELNPLVPEKMLKGILGEGEVKKIRYVKYEIPSDVFDAFPDGHREASGYMELSIVAGKNQQLPIREKVLGFINKQNDLHELAELQDFDFDYEKVKVEVDVRVRIPVKSSTKSRPIRPLVPDDCVHTVQSKTSVLRDCSGTG